MTKRDPNRYQRVHAHLTKAQIAHLKREAKAFSQPMAVMVRMAVQEFLDRRTPQQRVP